MTTPTAPSAAAQVAAMRGSAVWLPPGSPAITVGDYLLTGGLVYLGSAVPAAYAATYEPALIDPRVPVRRVRLDQETPDEGVRPSYAELTPGARAAYLEWLAAGRTGPTAAAHLWLFLYGLERRILVDLAGTLGALPEYAAIGAEVTTLRQRYPLAQAFDRQAAEFVDLLDALIGVGDPKLQPPPPGPRTGDLPMRLRVGIGRYVARGLPISAGWAYAWYAWSPHRVWGPAATRRPEEFRHAFAARYAEAYPGGGLVVPPPGDGLLLEYRPANPGFADRTVRIHTQLPDVRGLTEPMGALAAVAASAEADLSGRGPAPPRRPTATAAVGPAFSWPPAPHAHASAPAEPAATEPATPAQAQPAPAQPAPAAGNPGRVPDDTPKPAAADAPAGPDAVVSPAAPRPAPSPPPPSASPNAATDGSAETGTGAPELPYAGGPNDAGSARRVRLDVRPQVAAAETLLRLVVLAGLDDGYVRAVRRHVVDALSLTAAERHGLDDRLDRFALSRPDATLVRRRFAGLAAERQRAIMDLLIAAAGANGVVEPDQAIVLAAVFDLLGPGATELLERLRDLEVAAVVDESTMDVSMLDEELVAETLAGAVAVAAQVEALLAPLPRYANC